MTRNYYLDSDDLETLVTRFQRHPTNQAAVELGRAFTLLAERVCLKFPALDRADAVQDAVLICWQKHGHYRPGKGSAFGYFTECILNQCRKAHNAVAARRERLRKLGDYYRAAGRVFDERS